MESRSCDDALVEAGYQNYTIFRLRTTVVGYAECVPDVSAVLDRMASHPESARWAEALACFDSALPSDAAYVPAMINRAKTLLSLNRPAEALAGIARALELVPDKVTALNIRGRALAALGRTEEALTVFDAVIAPDWPHGYNNRGSAQAALNRFAAARASFTIATEIDPTLAKARKEALQCGALAVVVDAIGKRGHERDRQKCADLGIVHCNVSWAARHLSGCYACPLALQQLYAPRQL